ncbi:hypothetical protein Glove_141g54 [Diversispora epigaea]|uniref:Protein kinase domain-containing protein n=1 Tax=Diversispora epigaea TaxID=1348612 RepID=A0A397IZE4_9GLOM|nr:hypothetical protein Glove_141g54 [Diversispora epigaea]
MSSYTCPECNQEYNGHWCKPCNSKHFQNDFNNWTSGNDKIDKLIQDFQLNANNYNKVIEWIPYDRFKDINQIGKGGFGTIHYARWIDGYIEKWDIKNQQWQRYDNKEMVLKKFDNFGSFNSILWNYTDPETYSYMMVLQYTAGGNLREYLKINFNNINWEQKLNNLYNLLTRLMNVHKLDIVHQDFHPGNILSSNFKNYDIMISDFGIKVLSGDEEYTKAVDVYSFGIIAYEMVTGFSPYPDIPHDKDLAMKICDGL